LEKESGVKFPAPVSGKRNGDKVEDIRPSRSLTGEMVELQIDIGLEPWNWRASLQRHFRPALQEVGTQHGCIVKAISGMGLISVEGYREDIEAITRSLAELLSDFFPLMPLPECCQVPNLSRPMRRDPEDHQVRSFAAVMDKYGDRYTPAQIVNYWIDKMTPIRFEEKLGSDIGQLKYAPADGTVAVERELSYAWAEPREPSLAEPERELTGCLKQLENIPGSSDLQTDEHGCRWFAIDGDSNVETSSNCDGCSEQDLAMSEFDEGRRTQHLHQPVDIRLRPPGDLLANQFDSLAAACGLSMRNAMHLPYEDRAAWKKDWERRWSEAPSRLLRSVPSQLQTADFDGYDSPFAFPLLGSRPVLQDTPWPASAEDDALHRQLPEADNIRVQWGFDPGIRVNCVCFNS
jgi:hypothetical protein